MFIYTEIPWDAQEFVGTATLKSNWKNSYVNPSSPEYKTLSRDLIGHLTAVLQDSLYQADFLGVKVSNFREGSIIFDFTIYFNSTSNINENNLKDIIEKGLDGNSGFSVVQVDVRQKYPCKSPTEKPAEASPGLEKWIIVLIACQGACIFILLIIVLILLVGYFCSLQSTCALHQFNRPFSSCFEPHYESEA